MVIKSVDVHFDRHETKKVYLLKKKIVEVCYKGQLLFKSQSEVV